MADKITKDLTIELDSGQPVTVTVQANGTYDPFYGADADGNRSAAMWFLENIEYDDPEYDDEGDPLSDEQKEEFKVKIQTAAEGEPWDFSHHDEDEDYDPTEEEEL